MSECTNKRGHRFMKQVPIGPWIKDGPHHKRPARVTCTLCGYSPEHNPKDEQHFVWALAGDPLTVSRAALAAASK